MEFVNRFEEKARIQKMLAAEKPSFIVVYGRRRCGKSTLLKQVLRPKDIFFMADQTESAYQLQLFAQQIAVQYPDFDQVKYPNWEVLLNNLNRQLTQRICIVLDEFPYLVKSAPELPAVIQKLLDKGENKYDLILCGSSQQLMYGMIIDSTAPLYGRAQLILKVKPMKAPYLKEVLQCSASSAIEEYAVWGGVPRYWELRLQEESLQDALRQHLFSPLGILLEEPLRLFVDDIRDSAQSYTILSLIGNGVHRLSEIAARLEKPATQLSRPLEKLVQLGYIIRVLPFGELEKNSKKGIYQIADPFVHFYFSFVVPNRSFIELDKGAAVLQQLRPALGIYMSAWWEKLCRQAISGTEIEGQNFGMARSWWGSVSKTERLELDVVAESLDGRTLLVGECKWTEQEQASRLLFELEEKVKKWPFAQGKTIIPCLFLKNPPKDKVQAKVFLPEEVLGLLK